MLFYYVRSIPKTQSTCILVVIHWEVRIKVLGAFLGLLNVHLVTLYIALCLKMNVLVSDGHGSDLALPLVR
jgi:hypothetical protein